MFPIVEIGLVERREEKLFPEVLSNVVVEDLGREETQSIKTKNCAIFLRCENFGSSTERTYVTVR